MGLNKAFDRNFFIIDGAVKTSGGSNRLAKGQLAAVHQSKGTADGLKVLSSFAGEPKDEKFITLRVGKEKKTPGRSYSDKDFSTVPFSLNEVVELSVSAPKNTEHIVDEVVVGYDGTPGSEFNFKTGDAYFRLALELKGGAIEWRGGRGDTEFVSINVDIPECDPFDTCDTCDNCSSVDSKAIVMEAVERLRRKQLTGGKTVADFIDVTPVLSCDNDVTATLIPYNFYTLELCDTGDDSAKAIVEGQYNSPVKRVNRKGSTSTYEILVPASSGTPAAATFKIASIMPGCESCPAGYVEQAGGFVYAFTIEDDGSDQSALITALANYATGTIVKQGNSAGLGFYTAAFTAKLSDAAIAAFVGGAAPRNTATVELVGKVSDLCTNATVTSVAWNLDRTLNAVKESYYIWLPDTKCGDPRLAELQTAYAGLTINIAQKRVATLTGASGTATFTVGGTAYLATFATSLAQTAANFVTTHAAALSANKGVKVTASGATLTFENLRDTFPTITVANTAADLNATLAAVANVEGGCQTKYVTSVVTNLVGAECDVIYRDAYIGQAPESYDTTDWVKFADSATEKSGNCKAGIRFKSRVFTLDGDEALRNLVGFTETSTQIKVAAGFPDEIREGIGRLPKGNFEGKYLSRQQHRTHLAGNLRHLENEGRAYFGGLNNDKDYLGRLLRGETSNMQDNTVQYIQYKLKVSSFNHTQGFAGRTNDDINYNFFVEVGRHKDLENLLNKLAASAGKEGVTAFSK
jgi:hypothetical protein